MTTYKPDEKKKQDTRFAYHSFGKEQLKYSANMRESYTELAELIETSCPAGRYRSLAITSLEETAMWAQKSLAHDWEQTNELV